MITRVSLLKILFEIKYLSVLHLNIRSLKKHHEELEELLLSFNYTPSILAVTETWLTDADAPYCFKLTGYIIVLSRNRKSRGGVMIQCKDGFDVLGELDINLEESIAVKVFHQGLYCVLIAVYNPPRLNKMEFIERLDEVFESFQSLMPVIILGDMNIDTLKKKQFIIKVFISYRVKWF